MRLLKAASRWLFTIKPARCTNFTDLFWHETLHVSDSSSAYHEEFIHCTLASDICHTYEQPMLMCLDVYLFVCMTYISVECTVNKLLMMGRGTARYM